MKNLFAILAVAAVGPAMVSAQNYDHCICQNADEHNTFNNYATGNACAKWHGYPTAFGGNSKDAAAIYCTDNTCIDQKTFVRYCKDNGAWGKPNCWGTDCYN